MNKHFNSDERGVRSSPCASLEVGAPQPGSEHPSPAAAHGPTTNERTPEEDWRVAIHEASHGVLQRLLMGSAIGGVSIEPGIDYEGITWGPGHDRATSLGYGFSDEKIDGIVAIIRGAVPPRGEADDGEIHRRAMAGAIEAMGGIEGERLFLLGAPDGESGEGDLHLARGLASLICSSPGSIDKFVEFCRAEATELLKQNEHVVLAIAKELCARRELTGAEVDHIIERDIAERSLAEDHERRRAMRRLEENAAQAQNAAMFVPIQKD